MTTVLAVSGSPSAASRTVTAARAALDLLAARGYEVKHVAARDLPAAPLLAGDISHPEIHRVLMDVAAADGVVVATPIYKAAYTGVLKVLLDVLPQTGLAGKAVLPLATGGTLAHLLAVDYALRPVLSALGARHVVQGAFLLDSAFVSGYAEPGLAPAHYTLAPDAELRLSQAVEHFAAALPEPYCVAAVPPHSP